MNTEEDEFKRIEEEAKRRAIAKEYDDTQTYTSESAEAYAYRCGYEAGAVAEREAQRTWVGLTDDEMTEIVTDIDVDWGDLLWKVVCLTKIIETKLKEKNNG